MMGIRVVGQEVVGQKNALLPEASRIVGWLYSRVRAVSAGCITIHCICRAHSKFNQHKER